MKTNRNLELMKLAVDAEVRRVAQQNDIYDQQLAINHAISLGVSRKWKAEPSPDLKAQLEKGIYPEGDRNDQNADTEHLLGLEREAQEQLGYDL